METTQLRAVSEGHGFVNRRSTVQSCPSAPRTAHDQDQPDDKDRPRRKRRTPVSPRAAKTSRDKALQGLAEQHGALIDLAELVARNIAKRTGRVTSVEVLAALKARGVGRLVSSADPRWIGAVFHRRTSGWRRIGWEATGSHGRPVAIWTREASS